MNKPSFNIFRRITKRFVIICNIVLAIFFLLACLSFYLNPVKYWYIAFLGLAFPYLLLFVLLFLLIWLFFKSKWCLLNIAILLIGWQSVNAVFGFNAFSKKFTLQKKDSSTLRVLQWNTMSLGEYVKDRVSGSDIREKMLDYIKKQEADVLCFQEFFDSYHPEFSQNINFITQRLAYPYYYYSKDYERYGITKNGDNVKMGHWGTILFSKYPITDSGKVSYLNDDKDATESLSYIDILKDHKKVRVFSTHLQSIRLRKNDYEEIEKLKNGKETAIAKSKNIFSKVKRAYYYRKQQVDVIKATVEKLNYPVILTGDFNDVPNSYAYNIAKGKLQDVFLKKGFGVGRTFSAISPTLRIDYVFASTHFKVLQVKKDNINLSDHYPIVCDLQLK